MGEIVRTEHGKGKIRGRRIPGLNETGARYDVLIGNTLYKDIPHDAIRHDGEYTTYAAGGWCGVAYHPPKLVKS